MFKLLRKKIRQFIRSSDRPFPLYSYINNQNFWDVKTYRFIKKDQKNKAIVIRQIIIDRHRHQKFKDADISDQQIQAVMRLQDYYDKQFKFQYGIMRGHMIDG